MTQSVAPKWIVDEVQKQLEAIEIREIGDFETIFLKPLKVL